MIFGQKLIEESLILRSEILWKDRQQSLSGFVPVSEQSPAVIPEVKELVYLLADLDHVSRVRAVAPIATDLHWVEFELELEDQTHFSDSEWHEIRESVWDQSQDLVISCEWKLREKTQEDWCLGVQIVEEFSKLASNAKLIVVSYVQDFTPGSAASSRGFVSSYKTFTGYAN